MYFQTYRLAGEAAPTDKEDAVQSLFDTRESEQISSNDPIDVYIYCQNVEGKVRVDL